MINKEFWQAVAEKWATEDDGIAIPEVKTGGVEFIDPSVAALDAGLAEEVDDILADLGLDEDF